jgi:hypothetical protein
MHTSTTELLRNYPDGTVMQSLQYASEHILYSPPSLSQCITVEQEAEEVQEYEEVYMRHHHPMRVPVTLQVGNSHLRIITVRLISPSCQYCLY